MLSSLVKKVFIFLFLTTTIVIAAAYFYSKGHVYTNNENETGNTSGNLYNGGLFCQEGNTIYFSNDYDSGKLYSMDLTGGNIKKVLDQTAVYINTDPHYIYYINPESNLENKDNSPIRYNNGGVYRVSQNGKGIKGYTAFPSANLLLKGNFIYFQNYDPDHGFNVVRYQTNGTKDRTLTLSSAIPTAILNNTFYYYSPKDNNQIMSLDLSSFTTHVKYEGTYQYPIIMDDYVYYINPANNNTLCRMKKDGTEPTILVNESCSTYNITNSGQYLYYQVNGSKKNKICRLNLETMQNKVLLEGDYCNIHVTDNYVYFNNKKHTKIYEAIADGGNDVTELIPSKKASK